MQPTRVQPEITADDLANPPAPLKLTEPTPETPNLASQGIVENVRAETDNIIAAQTEEAKQLAKLREERAAFGLQDGLGSFRQEQMDKFELPQNMRELKDINLQLARMQEQSQLKQVDIAGGPGQTVGQANREITQEDRKFAVRSAGLAARAAVLQGNIETATTLVKDTVDAAYMDRTLRNTNLKDQIDDLSGVVDDQTQQLLDAKKREIEKEDEAIKEVKDAISSALLAGATTAEVSQLTGDTLSDDEKLALAQSIQAREARTDIELEREGQRASNAAAWASAAERAASDDDPSTDPDAIAGMSNTISLVRDSINRVLGSGEFDALYEGAGANPIAEFVRRNVGSSATTKTRLDAQLDTIKSNMLQLGSDPNIRQFFGPQMSEADVRMMMAAASRLQSSNMTPTEIKEEIGRIDTFIGKLEAAAEAKSSGGAVNPNVLVAPDGTQVEIID